MKSLRFENDGALQLALTTGLVPEDLAATPAGVLRQGDGKVVVFPSESLKRALELKLAAAGVALVKESREPTRQVGCWAQILLPRRTGTEPEKGPVLFVVPEDGSSLALGAEMLRLGCDRQDFCIVPGGPCLLRAVDPPYFTLASILDGSRKLQAFVPTPPGQDKVWTELGHAHPLGDSLKAPEGRLLLVGSDGSWREVADGPWTNLYSVLELEVPGAPHTHEKKPLPPSLKVRLRLAKASRNEPTALFVLRQNAVEQIDTLVRGCSDELVQRLLFAATGDPKDPTIILRSRPGRQAPPELQLAGEAYVPLLATGQLFIPRDASLEPPLRKEKIRDLLAPGTDEIAWLAPTGGDGFRVERIAEAAFSPLSDWVEYLVHSAPALESWVRRATFDFAFYESAGVEWADGPRRPEREEREERVRRDRPRAAREAAGPAAAPKTAPAPAAARPVSATPAEEYRLQPTGEEEQSLHALEKQFVEMAEPADHPSRSNLWAQMASLHARLRHGSEAGLCWTRSFWELGAAEAAPLVDRWARGESFLATQSTDPASALRTLLAVKAATRDQTRAMASLVTLAAQNPSDFVVDPHAAQVWLDANDDNLDVRSLWLARVSLSRLVGGDRLGVARTRDRILARLHRGLSLERDVPTFLRFLGQGPQAPLGSIGRGDGAPRLASVLGDLQLYFEKTERKRSPVEAPPMLTRAYVLFVFAYGYARLGAADRARSLRSTALGLLPAGEPIHGFLSRAYSFRVDLALEGLPVETPMPPAIQAELNQLSPVPKDHNFLRYKIDRLRQASTVLEPQERLDPIQAFQRGEKDPRGEEFATLRGMTDPGQLGGELEKLMKVALAQATKPEDSARLFDGIMDFFPMLPEAQALPRLHSLLGGMDDIEPVRRISLLEEALMLAGYFGRAELVRQIVATIEKLLGGLTPESANEVGGIIGRCLRSLRRVGLRSEAAHLLEAVAATVTGAGPKALSARLNLASGQAYLGRLDQAMPEFDRAYRSLQAKDLQMSDRLALTRACANALSQTPQEYAAAGIMRLAEQLKGVTDSYNTNSHFCLSVISFMESLVLGLASEDLALGEFGRRWLDEEEYLVRRRIQRENAEAAR